MDCLVCVCVCDLSKNVLSCCRMFETLMDDAVISQVNSSIVDWVLIELII